MELKKVYVAVSGGVDSMVLLWLCHHTGLHPIALHCNFKLRNEASDADETFVKDFCKKYKIKCETVSFNTRKIAVNTGETIQVAARNLRYNWFSTFIVDKKNSVVLTAHHQNDSIETFFINLLRGTGLKGLQGIPQVRERYYRPLLNFKKEAIIEYATQNSIPFREDESNESTKYVRNKLRLDILPQINNLSDNFEGKLTSLMHEIAETNAYLDAQTDYFISQNLSIKNQIDTIPIEVVNALDFPILLRFLSRYQIQRSQLNEIKKLLESSTGAIFENNHYTLLNDRGNIKIRKKIEPSSISIQVSKLPAIVKVEGKTITLSETNQKPSFFTRNTAYIDLDIFHFPILITNKFEGKKIQPLGMKGKKLVSDVLTDAKISKYEKANQLIITSKNEVVWIVNQTLSEKYSLTDHTKRILKIEISE